jgi:hypothetical protein
MRKGIIAATGLAALTGLIVAAFFWPTEDSPAAPFQCRWKLCVTEKWAGVVRFSTMEGAYNIQGKMLPRSKQDPALPLVSVTVPDSIVQLSPKPLTMVCSTSSCLAYHKFCNNVACFYVLSQPIANNAARDRQPIDWGYAMLVAFDKRDSLRSIETSVWLLTTPLDKKPAEYILLRRLDHLSTGQDVPHCGREDPGCPPQYNE